MPHLSRAFPSGVEEVQREIRGPFRPKRSPKQGDTFDWSVQRKWGKSDGSLLSLTDNHRGLSNDDVHLSILRFASSRDSREGIATLRRMYGLEKGTATMRCASQSEKGTAISHRESDLEMGTASLRSASQLEMGTAMSHREDDLVMGIAILHRLSEMETGIAKPRRLSEMENSLFAIERY